MNETEEHLILRKKLLLLSYKQLQKKAKSNSVPARGKKVDIADSLAKVLILNKENNANTTIYNSPSSPKNTDSIHAKVANIKTFNDDDFFEPTTMSNQDRQCPSNGDQKECKEEKSPIPNKNQTSVSAEIYPSENPIAASENLSLETSSCLISSISSNCLDISDLSNTTYTIETIEELEESFSSGTRTDITEEKISTNDDKPDGHEYEDQDKKIIGKTAEPQYSPILSKSNEEADNETDSNDFDNDGRSTVLHLMPPIIGDNSNSKSGSRFAKLHEKNFDSMESIKEYVDRREIFKTQYNIVSSVVQRLTSPKKTNRPISSKNENDEIVVTNRAYNFGNSPAKPPFRFGSVTSEVKRADVFKTPKTPGSAATRLKDFGSTSGQRMDVKRMTMYSSKDGPSEGKQLTPTWEKRITEEQRHQEKSDFSVEQPSSSSSSAPRPVPSIRRSYIPYKGPYRYIDTTKMSDSELRDFYANQQKHN